MNVTDINAIALYGAGTIGGGFAAYFALKGLDVNVYVRSEESAKRAEAAIQAPIDSFIHYNIAGSAQKLWDKITLTTDPERAFHGIRFIQENGAENIEQKHEMIAVMEKYAPEDAIIASSSSGLPATRIAEGAKHPERVIVAHPFNPAYLIPLVEICKGEKTSQETVGAAVEFYKKYDKAPIVLQKEKKGFVANRLAHALWREEIALVCEGVCSLEDADNAICFGPGLRWGIMGPAMGYELGGGDLGLRGCAIKFGAMTNSIFEDLSDMKTVPDEWPDISGEQIAPLMEHMPGHVGTTKTAIASFRDYMLIEMLKMHQKL
ncbi:MAG: 3-hydroxyacyl-CoA dehydrogenase family protein [Oscillospiraceae bacterium]|jgi:3-hydroxyacyl-CoA dehydrogenase|nr:3-hydroxyacyl-CoA dehydrogenase family protein [Oscillospiraceae bacterium]